MNVVVFGGSGYAGAELLRLLSTHPSFDVVGVGGESAAGKFVEDLYPGVDPHYARLPFLTVAELLERMERGVIGRIDLAFLALPHGVAESLVPKLDVLCDVVVDLSADFRLQDPSDYEQWYQRTHSQPERLASAVYGLPELNRSELLGARLVAAAGCYVTTVTLSLLPLVRSSVVERSGIVVDAASGVSGAGRSLKSENLFVSVEGNFSAYGLLRHRHTVEMQRNLDVELLFTPHLLPVSRGILATSYLRPTTAFRSTLMPLSERGQSELLSELYGKTYANEPFVKVVSQPPDIKSVLGSNECRVFVTYDPRTNWIVVLGALDNLTKGAAGQAVQCANLVFGLDETTGLRGGGFLP